jgi:hypothetical protein
MGRKIKTYKNRKKTTLRNKHKRTRKKYRTLKKNRRKNKKLRGGRPYFVNPQTKADTLASKKINEAKNIKNEYTVINKIAHCESIHPSPKHESKPSWKPVNAWHTSEVARLENKRGRKLYNCIKNIKIDEIDDEE